MSQRRKVRWLIAHFPQELFIRAAEAFAEISADDGAQCAALGNSRDLRAGRGVARRGEFDGRDRRAR